MGHQYADTISWTCILQALLNPVLDLDQVFVRQLTEGVDQRFEREVKFDSL